MSMCVIMAAMHDEGGCTCGGLGGGGATASSHTRNRQMHNMHIDRAADKCRFLETCRVYLKLNITSTKHI